MIYNSAMQVRSFSWDKNMATSLTADEFRVELATALTRANKPTKPGDISVEKKTSNLNFSIRLSDKGKVLPSRSKIIAKVNNGKLAPGTALGAKKLIVGAVQFSGGKIRVTARIFDVETGVITQAAKADAADDARGAGLACGAIVKKLFPIAKPVS